MRDQFERKIEYLRISVTDCCNLRCRYCMPAHGVKKLAHEDILSYEEILRDVRALAALGIRKVRMTGGEPLVRRDIVTLVRGLKEIPGIETVAVTTNGVLLGTMLDDLVAAGLDAVNLSLDTLDGGKFFSITRRPLFGSVMESLERLAAERRITVKLNCVPIAGVNDDEIPALAAIARDHAVSVRFIELMPIGCARTAGYRGVPMDEVRARLRSAFGALLPVGDGAHGAHAVPTGPAAYVRPAGFAGSIGFIDAMEHKFCSTCNRVRLTAEGFLKLCLYSSVGLDTRALLRGGASDERLAATVRNAVWQKPEEHYFENDTASRDRRAMYQVGG